MIQCEDDQRYGECVKEADARSWFKMHDEKAEMKLRDDVSESYVMSPYPTVVIVTTAHQNASGIDLKKLFSLPASAKYTADENRTTPIMRSKRRDGRRV